MEEALQIREESRRVPLLPLLLSAGVCVLCAVLAQVLRTQAPLLIGLGAVGVAGVWLLPLPYSILFFYLYLFFDGAIKILSNYHPLFHVAQDLIVLSLCARSISERGQGGIAKFSRTPHITLVFAFSLWILVQYLNPFGLGLLPSIAGTKVYVNGILIFLLAYHHFGRADAERVLTWLAFLGLMEGALATVEYLYFQGFVFTLHPRYAAIAGDRFVGDLFRPFGTTSAPGAPSMWIFLTAGIAFHLLLNARGALSRAIGAANLFFAVPTLVFCQTRAAILLTLVNLFFVAVCPHRGLLRRLAVLIVVGTVVWVGAGAAQWDSLITGGGDDGVRATQEKVLQDRVATLLQKETLESSRGGALDQAMELAGKTVFGIGLSRVGAASAVWDDRIAADPYFGKNWSFADNLFRAVFTELGIFGLVFWLALVLIPSLDLLRRSFGRADPRSSALLWLCGAYPVALIAGGFGSEGILYNPSSGFMWLMIALGLKEAQNFALEA